MTNTAVKSNDLEGHSEISNNDKKMFIQDEPFEHVIIAAPSQVVVQVAQQHRRARQQHLHQQLEIPSTQSLVCFLKRAELCRLYEEQLPIIVRLSNVWL